MDWLLAISGGWILDNDMANMLSGEGLRGDKSFRFIGHLADKLGILNKMREEGNCLVFIFKRLGTTDGNKGIGFWIFTIMITEEDRHTKSGRLEDVMEPRRVKTTAYDGNVGIGIEL